MKILLLHIIILSTTLFGSDNQDYQEYLIKDNLTINFPVSFIQLDSMDLVKKYRNKPFMPTVEFYDTEKSMTFQISYGTNPLNPELVEELRASYEKNFKEIYPDAIWLETKTKQINSLTVGYFETLDNENYNLVFFTSLNNKQIHFAIQGRKENLDTIQKIARKIMESIKIKN